MQKLRDKNIDLNVLITYLATLVKSSFANRIFDILYAILVEQSEILRIKYIKLINYSQSNTWVNKDKKTELI